MRRKDREITDPAAIEALLREARVCRIGLADNGEPYVVPVIFGYEDRALYIHSAPDGKKIAMITKNPRCCFEADIPGRVIRSTSPCSWGMHYRSVIGYGSADILESPEEKRHGLNCIMRHYGGRTHEFSEHDLEMVAVIRIVVETITGKKR